MGSYIIHTTEMASAQRGKWAIYWVMHECKNGDIMHEYVTRNIQDRGAKIHSDCLLDTCHQIACEGGLYEDLDTVDILQELANEAARTLEI